MDWYTKFFLQKRSQSAKKLLGAISTVFLFIGIAISDYKLLLVKGFKDFDEIYLAGSDLCLPILS
jgi:hypothetical protein